MLLSILGNSGMKKYAAVLIGCALLMLSACDPSVSEKTPGGDLPVKTINYQLDPIGYYQFYTNDTANCLGGYGYFSNYLDVTISSMQSVEVATIKNSGKSGYMYGIVFCYLDESNYYRLLINQGSYEIFRHAGTVHSWWNFTTSAWVASPPSIYPTSSNLSRVYGVSNLLKVTRTVAGVFDLYFNSTLNASFSDMTFVGGKNGFMTFVGLPTDEDFPNYPVDVRYKLISAIEQPWG